MSHTQRLPDFVTFATFLSLPFATPPPPPPLSLSAPTYQETHHVFLIALPAINVFLIPNPASICAQSCIALNRSLALRTRKAQFIQGFPSVPNGPCPDCCIIDKLNTANGEYSSNSQLNWLMCNFKTDITSLSSSWKFVSLRPKVSRVWVVP